MKLYRFGPEVGRHIAHYDSDFVMSRLVRVPHGTIAESGIAVGCMHIGAGGIVGFHQATVPQLFLVVAGAGWVTGSDRERQPIEPFVVAFWEGGEWHESGSETGMTAIVIEGEGLDPASFMPEA